MRGRLINPFWAEIEKLDTASTAEDPDGAGPLASGFDDDFREPVKLPADTGEGAGTTVRVEYSIRVPCQVEVASYEQLSQMFTGNNPNALLTLVLHFKDLERLGYVDPVTKDADLRIGDRLAAFYDRRGRLVQKLRDPMYCTQVQPNSFGLGYSRNLLLVTFQSRDKGVRV